VKDIAIVELAAGVEEVYIIKSAEDAVFSTSL
jgi:hypothetical protein